jgi:hypothetical protein
MRVVKRSAGEQVLLQRVLSRPPRPMLRVKRGSYFIAD